MLEAGTRNIEIATTDIIHGFIVDQERAVRVLDGGVRRENRIVGLNDGGADARSRVDGEFEFGFLAIVGREAFEEERAEA